MMEPLNAFVTPEYPVLFTVLEEEDEVVLGPTGSSPVPPGMAALSLALLVEGIPSFLGTSLVAADEVNSTVASLEDGDVRVAVVGLTIEVVDDEEGDGYRDPVERSAAFVSVVCQDGRRVEVARIVGKGDHNPERLARYVIKAITRGVQIPDLAAAG